MGTSAPTYLVQGPEARVSLEGNVSPKGVGWGSRFPSEKWGRQIGRLLLLFLTTKRKLWEIKREVVTQTKPGFLALSCDLGQVLWLSLSYL